MKKMKFFALAVFALAMGLTSCSNDDVNTGNSVDTRQKNVYLRMTNAPNVTTRSESESGLSNTATLTKGVVLFVNGGEITRYVNISTTGGDATYVEPTSDVVPTISISDIMSGAGVQFANIRADKVYIIGNRTDAQLAGLPVQNADGTIATGSKIADLLTATGSLLDAATNGLSDGKQADVALYGVNSLTQESGDNYKASVELVPVVARLEIKEIYATDVIFNLAGIFVNNYYTKAQLDGGMPASAALKNNMNVIANYVEAYSATALRDWSPTSLGAKVGNATDGFSVKPTIATNVWGYNVFPAKNEIAGDKKLPRIVLRLTDVEDALGEVTNSEGQQVDKFITVTGFTDGVNPVTEFKAGYVYTITKIVFNKSNLTDEPEITDRIINATVIVSIRGWVDAGEIIPEI